MQNGLSHKTLARKLGRCYREEREGRSVELAEGEEESEMANLLCEHE